MAVCPLILQELAAAIAIPFTIGSVQALQDYITLSGTILKIYDEQVSLVY